MTILACEKGGDSIFLDYDQSVGGRPWIGKTKFKQLAQNAGLDLKPSPRMARKLPSDMVDNLERGWPDQ
jgi:hypothetical protein